MPTEKVCKPVSSKIAKFSVHLCGDLICELRLSPMMVQTSYQSGHEYHFHSKYLETAAHILFANSSKYIAP